MVVEHLQANAAQSQLAQRLAGTLDGADSLAYAVSSAVFYKETSANESISERALTAVPLTFLPGQRMSEAEIGVDRAVHTSNTWLPRRQSISESLSRPRLGHANTRRTTGRVCLAWESR